MCLCDIKLRNLNLTLKVTLARELGIPYAATALVTDYDCWREGDEQEHQHVVLVVLVLVHDDCATGVR
jgi:purine nucleoside phosphorylase